MNRTLATTPLLLTGLAAGLGLSVACKSTALNPDHCANREGDRTCAELYPDGSRPYCGWGTCFESNDGCVETLPSEASCYSPCGGEKTADDDDACVDVGSSMTDSGTSDTDGTAGDATMGPGPGTDTEPTASTGGTMDTGDTDGGCTGPEQCDDPDLPFCEMGACVPCSSTPDPDASCLALDPATPVCTDAKCSPCSDDPSVCTGPTPICADSGECVPCNAHDQCPAMAGCDLLVGECLPADAVYYVDNSGACPGDGSDATPFCSFTDAINAIGANNAGTIRIAAGNTYGQDLAIGGSQTIALLGTGGNAPVIDGDGGGDPNILSVTNAGTTVYADHLRLQGNVGAPAIEVNAATFYGTRLEVVQNSGGGLTAAANATVYLVNSALGGPAAFNTPTISIASSDLELLYSTVVGGFGASPAISCMSPGTVDLRNAILLSGSGGAEVSCAGATITDSATEANAGAFDGSQAWFADFSNGDFRLADDGPATFADLATWQDGDPLTDIDGDARPGTDGAADYPGADVP